MRKLFLEKSLMKIKNIGMITKKKMTKMNNNNNLGTISKRIYKIKMKKKKKWKKK